MSGVKHTSTCRYCHRAIIAQKQGSRLLWLAATPTGLSSSCPVHPVDDEDESGVPTSWDHEPLEVAVPDLTDVAALARWLDEA